MYFINGYKFHTKLWSAERKTTNYGVHDIIDHIYELKYKGLSKKIPLFYCTLFDATPNSGTMIHSQYNIVEVKMSGKYSSYDPFILPQKVR